MVRDQTVLVEEGRITALGPAVKVPPGAVRIDGRGKFLMPGLADMHLHSLPSHDIETYDQLVYRLFIRLANGVTSVRHLNWKGADDQEGREKLLAHFKAAEILIPRLYLPASFNIGGPRELDNVTAFVKAVKAKGYGFFMIDGRWGNPVSGRSKPLYDSLLVTARLLGLPVASHSNGEGFEDALAMGAYNGSVEHVEYMFSDIFARPDAAVSTAELGALAAKVQRAGVWITLTLDCIAQYEGMPSRPSITTAQRLVKALQDAGARLLLGADADGSHGRSASIVHKELQALVRAGFSPYQSLVTGTRNVAQYFGILDSSGTVAVGKRADLVLLHGNPLIDIRHTREPAGVMLGGRWLDRAALDEGLLALPAFWFQVEMGGGFTPQPDEQSAIGQHIHTLAILADSLTAVKWRESDHLRQRLAEELGVMRAKLTPEQREDFDPKARIWLRDQARKGYRLTVAGVAPTP